MSEIRKLNNRVEALRAKHAEIEEKLRQEGKHPASPDRDIRALKLQKLQIKDEIEELQSANRRDARQAQAV